MAPSPSASPSPSTPLKPQPAVERVSSRVLVNAIIDQPQVIADYIYELENSNRTLIRALLELGKVNFRAAQTSMSLLTGDIAKIAGLYFEPIDYVFEGLDPGHAPGRVSRPAILNRSLPAKKEVTQDVISTTDQDYTTLEIAIPSSTYELNTEIEKKADTSQCSKQSDIVNDSAMSEPVVAEISVTRSETPARMLIKEESVCATPALEAPKTPENLGKAFKQEQITPPVFEPAAVPIANPKIRFSSPADDRFFAFLNNKIEVIAQLLASFSQN